MYLGSAFLVQLVGPTASTRTFAWCQDQVESLDVICSLFLMTKNIPEAEKSAAEMPLSDFRKWMGSNGNEYHRYYKLKLNTDILPCLRGFRPVMSRAARVGPSLAWFRVQRFRFLGLFGDMTLLVWFSGSSVFAPLSRDGLSGSGWPS